MATPIKVVLQKDVDNLGHGGDVVRVRPGFARNFLVPRGMAVAATESNLKRVDELRRAAVAHAQKSLAEAKGDIQSRLTYERRQQKRNTLMAEIRKKAEVQIDEAQLAKFTLPPSGSGPSAAAPDRRSPGPGPGAPPPAPPTQGR